MKNQNVLDIQDKIKEIIISVADFKMDKDMIEDGKDGIKKLGLNSLSLIRMLVDIENEFDVEIDMQEMGNESIFSIEDLAEYIVKLKN